MRLRIHILIGRTMPLILPATKTRGGISEPTVRRMADMKEIDTEKVLRDQNQCTDVVHEKNMQ